MGMAFKGPGLGPLLLTGSGEPNALTSMKGPGHFNLNPPSAARLSSFRGPVVLELPGDL
jgi:hypothetical protein